MNNHTELPKIPFWRNFYMRNHTKSPKRMANARINGRSKMANRIGATKRNDEAVERVIDCKLLRKKDTGKRCGKSGGQSGCGPDE